MFMQVRFPFLWRDSALKEAEDELLGYNSNFL